MIVEVIDQLHVGAVKAENDAPVAGHADRPLAGRDGSGQSRPRKEWHQHTGKGGVRWRDAERTGGSRGWSSAAALRSRLLAGCWRRYSSAVPAVSIPYESAAMHPAIGSLMSRKGGAEFAAGPWPARAGWRWRVGLLWAGGRRRAGRRRAVKTSFPFRYLFSTSDFSMPREGPVQRHRDDAVCQPERTAEAAPRSHPGEALRVACRRRVTAAILPRNVGAVRLNVLNFQSAALCLWPQRS